jgi:peptidoglycan hydrolase CwlO-like protein
MGSNNDSGWHLDKRVNISIIFGLIIQTIIVTSFIVGLDYRVKALEKEEELLGPVPTNLAVLSTEVAAIKDDVADNTQQLDRIEEKIDQLQEER